MKNFKLWLYAFSFLLLALSVGVRAQTNVGIIRGTVTDQNGAAIKGAIVKLTNAITNYTQGAATDERGAYQLVDVPFNRYTLTVQAPGFEPSPREIVVRANLIQQIDLQLGVAAVRQTVEVNGTAELLDTEKTAPSVVIDRNRILTFPTSQPSRSTEEIIATAPGWTLDANGRLHARGIEYQVQYSVDGVPVTDTIADTFASSPDPRNFRSVEVSTANIQAEYGNKLAGLIEVTTRSGLEIEKSGNVTLSGGSFNTFEGSFDVGGHTRKFGYFLSAAATSTHRFLDPPALENFHNRGRSAKGFFKFDYQPNENDLIRLNLFVDGQHFDVPNLPDQEAEGQDQRRRTSDNMQSLSWQHIFSPRLVSNLAVFHRYNDAKLSSNLLAAPVFAEQSRHQSTYGAVGSLTYNIKRHTIKTGFELERFPVTESFTFAITDLEDLLEKEPDLTEEAQEFTLANPFFFNDHRTGWEGSLYVQDHFNATRNLTLDLGLRFDSYHFLVHKNFLSPRLGVSYYIDKTRTVLRGSVSRFLETPALENLLLSSSEEARVFSPGGEEEEEEAALRSVRNTGRSLSPLRAARMPGGAVKLSAAADEDMSDGEDNADKGAPVQLSREWQFDVGFQQQLGRYLRLDADYYYRRLTNPPEITNFLETGIIFPANLARSRSQGVETRLDVARVRGFSGFLSYTNLYIYGFAPITGGLFLGEAVDLLKESGQRIKIEEDQRNTVVFEGRYDYQPQRLWLLFSGRHDSGFSVELEPDVTAEEFANEFPEKILDQVNIERGFIKPHTVLNFAVGKEFPINEHISLIGQFNVENLTNKFYLITFESVFSGTTIGRPRSFSGNVRINFK
jgi:TonB dependent receptor/Carboxypeptidase regulatory-like domain/TonB-dependent Receptor Plug Domain